MQPWLPICYMFVCENVNTNVQFIYVQACYSSHLIGCLLPPYHSVIQWRYISYHFISRSSYTHALWAYFFFNRRSSCPGGFRNVTVPLMIVTSFMVPIWESVTKPYTRSVHTPMGWSKDASCAAPLLLLCSPLPATTSGTPFVINLFTCLSTWSVNRILSFPDALVYDDAIYVDRERNMAVEYT